MTTRYDWANDDEACATLARLWSQDSPRLNIKQIAAAMDTTPGAITGAVRRCNLPRRDDPNAPRMARDPVWAERKNKGKKAAQAPASGRLQEGPPLPRLPRAPRQPPPVRRVFHGQRPPCCWPIGEPGSEGFRYCGVDIVAPGKPYCADHTSRAYVSAEAARRDIVPFSEIEAYAQQHRIVPPVASGLAGLVVAVNNHRIAQGLRAYATQRKDGL